MEKFADRLKKALDLSGVTQEELAKLIDVSQQNISYLVREAKRGSSKTNQIAQILKVNSNWLATGEGDIYGEQKNYHQIENKIPVEHLLREIPVKNCCYFSNDDWVKLENSDTTGYLMKTSKEDGAYAIRCYGDAMRPRIKHGEFVIVEPNCIPLPGREVLVISKTGEVMIRTLLYILSGRIYLVSINENQPSISLTHDEIDKILPITAIVSDLMLIEN